MLRGFSDFGVDVGLSLLSLGICVEAFTSVRFLGLGAVAGVGISVRFLGLGLGLVWD